MLLPVFVWSVFTINKKVNLRPMENGDFAEYYDLCDKFASHKTIMIMTLLCPDFWTD